ncbi:MAG: nucleoside 2-deoxyribosyltransferase [bacterium]|nr:nucleoside 2-deoxyribosyltransferase [bacterium]
MKIYFAGSIRGGRDDIELYIQIIELLKSYGEVLTEVGNKEISTKSDNRPTDVYIHDRDIMWLKDSDVMIAEVTNPSLGVGYEIGKAEEMNKTIVCLYRKQDGRALSSMIRGSSKVAVLDYESIDELKAHFHTIFSK